MATLPAQFTSMLARHPEFDGLAAALCGTPPEVSVRLNARKTDTTPQGYVRVPWCPSGIYLPERPAFTFDPQLHQGLFYVQDASSMVLRHIASRLSEEDGPMRWLDACAAPGGKTTAIADALPDGSLVHAHEYDLRRCAALVENLERWGCPATAVTRGDTAQLSRLRDFYDVISVDAPCSGEGMMRKEPDAVAQWSQGLVQSCAATQRRILQNVWPALRPGGVLVYSTCTFNTTENEENVLWLCNEFGAEPVDMGLTAFEGVVGDISGHGLPVARFIPGRIRGEGLFVCVMRKPGDAAPARVSMPRKFRAATLPDWLYGDFTCVADDTRLYALPAANAAEMLAIPEARTRGIYMGEVKGRDIIPSVALARSTALRRGSFAEYEADLATALTFLRGEVLHLGTETPRGIILLTYRGHPLGFVKNIGNRANNLLPDNRRIISQIPSPLPQPIFL